MQDLERIIEGMDEIDKIANVKTDYNDRPLEDIKLKKLQLIQGN
ncbi:MAG: hypothetical protein ACLTA5_07630 [Anaerococcus obesiensis]